MNKFKVGDEVKVVANTKRLREIEIYNESFDGLVGEIIGIGSDVVVVFSLKYPVGLREIGIWCFAEQDLELVESRTEQIDSKTDQLRIKSTNPKDIIGVRKAPISTLSCAVLFEMGLGMMEGARKYGRHNYRAMGVSATVYYDAAMGHLMDWFEGEDIDSDSGLSHVTKALTTLLTLRDSMLMNNWVDDRPLRNPNKLYKKHFNLKAKEIIEKYPDGEEPYLEIRKNTKRGG